MTSYPTPARRAAGRTGSAVVPAGCAPELEVQVAAASVPALADRADRLARVHAVAGAERGGLVEVHVHVVDLGSVAVDHDVVAGRRVVLLELDPAAARRDHPRAARANTSWPWWEWPARPGPNPRPRRRSRAGRAPGRCGRRGRRSRAVRRPSASARLGAVGGRGGEPERVAPGPAAARPNRPFQETLCTTSAGTSCGVQVFTTVPSSRAHELDLERGRRSRTAGTRTSRRDAPPTYAFVRLVPVSSRGAPFTRGPGTGRARRSAQAGAAGGSGPASMGAERAGGRGDEDRPGDRAERHARVDARCSPRARDLHVVAAAVAAEVGELPYRSSSVPTTLSDRAAARAAASTRTSAGR